MCNANHLDERRQEQVINNAVNYDKGHEGMINFTAQRPLTYHTKIQSNGRQLCLNSQKKTSELIIFFAANLQNHGKKKGNKSKLTTRMQG